MKAMILAAGRGERMRPLTDHTPKPLLLAGGKPLIVWHIERLVAAGFRDLVINHAHFGERLIAALGNGERWGAHIAWSAEPPGALETAGGIAKALPLLTPQEHPDTPFLVINGDIWTDWDFNRAHTLKRLAPGGAHLVMKDNPEHHTGGDFRLEKDGDVENSGTLRLARTGDITLTYCGIGLFSPAFFAGVPASTPMKLRPLLDAAIPQGKVTGERHRGQWVDVGTPERLAALDKALSQDQNT